jgi:hypothetical protein
MLLLNFHFENDKLHRTDFFSSFLKTDENIARLDVITMVSTKIRVFWNTAPCSSVEFTLKMDAAGYSEMPMMLISHTTIHHIPEDCNLHINVIHISRFRTVSMLALLKVDVNAN